MGVVKKVLKRPDSLPPTLGPIKTDLLFGWVDMSAQAPGAYALYKILLEASIAL